MTTTAAAATTKKTRRRRLASPVIPAGTDLSHIIEPLRGHAVHVSALKPDPQNPQIHDEANLEAIATSMRTYGQDQPIIYRREDGVIIKGNGRYLAAKVKLGWEYLAAVPVDDAKVKAAARGIADNQSNRLAKSDDTLMAILVETIKSEDDTLVPSLGFGDRAIENFLAGLSGGAETRDEDDVPKPKGRVKTHLGDLWLLDQHRVLCGDCTDPAVIDSLMNGQTASCVMTDPPYGVDYNPASGTGSGGERPGQTTDHEPIVGDRLTDDELVNDLLAPALTNAARVLRPDGALYCFYANDRRRDFETALDRAGLVEVVTIIWAKPSTACRGDYRYAHEPCFYAHKDGQRPKFYGDKAQTTVWRIGFATRENPITVLGTGLLLLDGTGSRLYLAGREPKGRKMRRLRLEEGSIFVAQETGVDTVWEITRDGGFKHPTQKPVEFCRRAIVNSSKTTEIVLDPFLGSGSTLIAADSVGRRCFGTEITPKFCDLIVERWQKVSGKTAERVKAGDHV